MKLSGVVKRGKRHDVRKGDTEGVDANFDQVFADLRALVGELQRYRINLSYDVIGNLGVEHLNGGLGADAGHVWAGDGTWRVGGGFSASQVATRVLHGI